MSFGTQFHFFVFFVFLKYLIYHGISRAWISITIFQKSLNRICRSQRSIPTADLIAELGPTDYRLFGWSAHRSSQQES